VTGPATLEAMLREIVREVVREEARAALAVRNGNIAEPDHYLSLAKRRPCRT